MKTHHTQNGFSLLELLTVMGIMALLSTLAVTGYLSATRGMAKQRAVSGLSNALVLARQRACTDSTPVSLICFNVWSGAEAVSGAKTMDKRKAATPTYVICKAIGQVSDVKNGGRLLGDEFAPLDRLFGLSRDEAEQRGKSDLAPIRLYNLSRGGWSDVYKTVIRGPYQSAMMFPSSERNPAADVSPHIVHYFQTKTTVHVPNGWKVGDVYGVAVSPVAKLPKTIYFGNYNDRYGTGSLSPDSSSGSSTAPPAMVFTFKPDGTPGASSQWVKLLSLEPDLQPFTEVRVNSDGDVQSDRF